MSIASLACMQDSEFQNRAPLPDTEWEIALTVTACADRSRLYSAITIPEYMETWMHLPGDSRSRNLSVTEIPGGFLVSGAAAANKQVSIVVQYRVSRRSKVIFTWKDQRFENPRQSIVTIRLVGDFARTNVLLKHDGTGSWEDYCWHRSFWQQSLNQLSGLFRRSVA